MNGVDYAQEHPKSMRPRNAVTDCPKVTDVFTNKY